MPLPQRLPPNDDLERRLHELQARAGNVVHLARALRSTFQALSRPRARVPFSCMKLSRMKPMIECNSVMSLACALDGPERALREALKLIEQLRATPLTLWGDVFPERARRSNTAHRGPNGTTRRNPAGLTSRECQVLALIAEGRTNAQLAQRLHVSPKTADHHVSAVLRKLGVRSRAEAVARAFPLGLVKSCS
ncbi:MAG: response regulator transcription factor [Steroidobacteraceae bacterium]|nr:response regulator transcription factor [Steroidobacteraceae bacterium]